MTLLAVDTSSLAASCALWEKNDDEIHLVGEFFTNAGLTHSQTILPMIAALMECAHKKLEDVDCYAVSSGPGSFTGLRIGIAAVKGIAFANDQPCIPISTLEGLAANVLHIPGLVVPVMDARCNQVYTSMFECDGASLSRLEEDLAIPIAQLGEKLLQYKDKPVYLVGDGATLCAKQLSHLSNIHIAPAVCLYQRASSVGWLALQKSVGAQISAKALIPSYLRLAQAERERLAREGNTDKL